MSDHSSPNVNCNESDKRFELFKFYEDASQRTKSNAWTQATWVLTLSGAILAFSINLYIEHCDVAGFKVIEWACALSGVVLSAYVIYVLYQLGKHIRKYWTSSNRLAAPDEFLKDYISDEDAKAAKHKGYKAKYPPFIIRLFIPPAIFAVGHIAWVIYVGYLGCA